VSRGRRRFGPRPALAVVALAVAVTVAAGPTPPPTPVPPFGSPSPFPTALQTPEPSATPPHMSAPSWILEDVATGQVLDSSHPRMRRPIASTTKILTAILVIESAELSARVTVSATAATQSGASLGLEPGEQISVRQLLYGLLLQSSNDAAVALAEQVGGSVDAFVAEMNDRARSMHLRDTHMESPSGLDDRGFSTVRDLAAMARAAYGFPAFAKITRTKFHDVPSPTGVDRHIQNRNVLLWLYRGAVGVKTGFTSAAGHCLVAVARRGGRTLVSVVLGEPTEQAAFDDGAALLNFGFVGFEPVGVVGEGDPVGEASVEGAPSPVPAVADADLRVLVPTDRTDQVQRTFLPAGDLALPVIQGQPVGRVVATLDGRKLGSVPAVAASSLSRAEPPPAAPPGWPDALALIRLALLVLRTAFGGFLPSRFL
jgi:serine-type D-Ala-D-Ala carboxypeptidase (penicillin-binding protein 5/6)